MRKDLLAERTRAMIPGYELMFNERGGVLPSDPLEFITWRFTGLDSSASAGSFRRSRRQLLKQTWVHVLR